MSTDIKGLFFKDQLLGARGLGAFGASALSDGILNGCEVTLSSGTATIAPGHIIVGGRVIRIANSIEVGSVGAAFTSIVATVDLTQTSTKSTFNQVSLSLAKNATLANVLTGDANDINLSGTTHSAWLWVHDATDGIPDTYRYAKGKSKELLWQNLTSGGASAVGDGFAAQALVLPGLSEFKGIEITFLIESGLSYYDAQTMNIPGAAFLLTNSDSGSAFNGKKYFPWYANSTMLTEGIWHILGRQINIYPEIDTLDFTTGWRKRGTNSTGSAGTYMVPVEIYGVR